MKRNPSPAKPKKYGNERRIKLSDDLLWGVHPVYEALLQDADKVSEIILLKDKRGSKWEEIIALARSCNIKLSFVQSLKITGDGGQQLRHQGIIAKISQASLLPFGTLVEKFEKRVKNGEIPQIIVCDSLQDPHNLGAIIRSAHAAGMTAVLTTREKSAPLSGTAAKSSAGAISHIDITQVTNLANALQELKRVGAWIFGSVKDTDAQSLYETDLRVPACIVVGSEGKGIRPLVKKQCDMQVSIPMIGTLDSLNSSVAAGVIMFEALRQNIVENSKK